MAAESPESATDTENERQYRIVDQSISAHGMLRDRYAMRACLLTLAGLIGAVCLNAFVFAGDDVYRIFGLSSDLARIGLGVCSVLLLVVAIFELRVDWKAKADRHRRAYDRLSSLKLRYRKEFAAKDSETWNQVKARLTQEYDSVMAAIPEIPERMFTRAKAAHAFKRAMSQAIDDSPGAPHWVLWLLVKGRGIATAARRRGGDG